MSAGVSDPRALPRPASPVGGNDGGSFGAGEGTTVIAGIEKKATCRGHRRPEGEAFGGER